MKNLFSRLGAVIALFAIALPSAAQTAAYPGKPIKIIIPFAAGGPTDLVARGFAEDLSKGLEQPVIVENRSGANGLIGTVAVATAPADGYTLLYTSLNHTVNPLLIKNVGYDPIKSFAPISLIAASPAMLVVGATQPYRTLSDLMQAAKAKKGSVSFGSAGVGGSAHLTGEMLNAQSGAQMIHVPYKGNGPAVIDVMSGHVTFMFYPFSGLPEVLAVKRLRMLASTGSSRDRNFPDVPTMKELGFKDFEGSHPWTGLLAPAGTPSDIVKKLNEQVVRSTTSGALKKQSEISNARLIGSSPEAFGTFIIKDKERWQHILDSAGIRPE